MNICRLLLPALLALGLATSAVAGRPPNIIFILIDDLGQRDLGCYGSTFYETPNLDRLAREGMRFTSGYAACSVCSPTRASLLTGKYPARIPLTNWIPGQANGRLLSASYLHYLPLEETTIAEALKESGYATAHIGKWHLGGPRYYPEKQGYEVNIGGCEMGHPPSYFSPYKIPTLTDGPAGEYLTDRLTDEALKFIDSAQSRPFYLQLWHYGVHVPLQAKPALVEKFKEKKAKMTFTAPLFGEDHGVRVRLVQEHAVYAAMIASIDESVGRVMQKLADLGLAQNTIIVFSSDNGGLSTAEGWPTSNMPLRTGKGWSYEGGLRVPLLVKWPGIVAPGSETGRAVTSPDFYPTFLEMAQAPLRPEQHVDGRSFLPVLKGGPWPDRPLFWHYPHYANQGGYPSGVVRLGDWKLIENFEDEHPELYHLSEDLSEQHDVASAQPAKTEELTKLLHDWQTSIHARMMAPNPDFQPPSPAGPALKSGEQEH